MRKSTMLEQQYDTSLKRKHHQEDIPWTVARCNRLLRSISSRIATIRRLSGNVSEILRRAQQLASEQPSPESMKSAARSHMNITFLANPHSPSAQDPEWMPRNERRPSTRKYGGNGRQFRSRKVSSSSLNATPAGTTLRTPFLRKLLRPDADVSPLEQPLLADPYRKSEREARTKGCRRLPVRPSTTLGESHRSLGSSFKTFLTSTQPMGLPVRKGARTLRDICLKRVPEYIEIEQTWRQEEGEEGDLDATSETYAFLENLGRSDKSGFSGLRQVVRSHGLDMIVRSVDERLLPSSVVQELVEICVHCDAVAEGQAILSAWSVSGERIPLSRLSVIVDTCLRLHSAGFLLQLLAESLRGERITKIQLTEVGPVWSALLRAFATPDGRSTTMMFLEAYFLAATRSSDTSQNSGEEDSSRLSLFRSLAVLTTAMIWMQERGRVTAEHFMSLSGQLQHLLHAVYTSSNDLFNAKAAEPFILSALMTVSASSNNDNPHTERLSVESLVDLLCRKPCRDQSSQDVTFLADVARAVGHFDADLAYETVRAVTSELARASKRLDLSSAKLLRELAMESAMFWAEDRDDKQGYDFAESVDELFVDDDGDIQTSRTPAPRGATKYRWEAALCEWITATPSTAVKGVCARRTAILTTSDDSGICMQMERSPTSKRDHSHVETEDDSDLEDGDELSLRTPKLGRLRERRLKKARCDRSLAEGKENAAPPVHGRHWPGVSMDADDLSEDELGA